MTDYSSAIVEIQGTGLSTTTSSNGAYSISDIPSGTQTVIASKGEFYESKNRTVVLNNNLTDINFDLTFEQPPPLPTKK